MTNGRSLSFLLLALTLASCQRPPVASPHFVLGAPYQVGGTWYYPRDSYELRETGLATVYPSSHPDLTADGEVFDQTALAAAHQTLQLPAIARLTNLENGRQVLVRINDRGPATPHRLIEVTRRTATLLGFAADDGVRVQVQVLPVESHAAADALPGAPMLDIAVAPVGAVQQSDLPRPGGVAQVPIAAPPPVVAQAATAPATVQRLPETVAQGRPDPGRLYVRLGSFQNFEYADIQRARVAGLGAGIVSTLNGRAALFSVIVGPFTSVSQADVVLDQVIRAGVTEARIVVE